MPGPLSVTLTFGRPASIDILTFTFPPGPPYFRALSSRFRKSRLSWPWSASTSTESAASDSSMEVPDFSASPERLAAAPFSRAFRLTRERSRRTSLLSKRARVSRSPTILDIFSVSSRLLCSTAVYSPTERAFFSATSSSPLRMVSGVFNSWETSWMKRRSERKESSSRASIALKRSASSRISSRVCGGFIRRLRFLAVICRRVRAMFATGRSATRAKNIPKAPVSSTISGTRAAIITRKFLRANCVW